MTTIEFVQGILGPSERYMQDPTWLPLSANQHPWSQPLHSSTPLPWPKLEDICMQCCQELAKPSLPPSTQTTATLEPSMANKFYHPVTFKATFPCLSGWKQKGTVAQDFQFQFFSLNWHPMGKAIRNGRKSFQISFLTKIFMKNIKLSMDYTAERQNCLQTIQGKLRNKLSLQTFCVLYTKSSTLSVMAIATFWFWIIVERFNAVEKC